MKKMIKKRWFRVLLRTTVIGLTLLVLSVAIFNWRTAREKNDVIARARAAGLPLTLEEFTAGMPPDDQNFARSGFMKMLEEEYENPSRHKPAPASAKARFLAVGDKEVLGALARHRRKNPDFTDFSQLPENSAYGNDAASFLKEFDRRHGSLLDELKAAFSLPFSRPRFVPENFTGGVALSSLSAGYPMDSRGFQDGMRLRAEAALVTGDSGKAAESIGIMARMSETVGSRGMLVSSLVEFVSLREIRKPLKIGIRKHQWTTEDLEKIFTALSRPDLRQHVRKGIESEILMIHLWEEVKKDRKQFSMVGPFLWNGDDTPVVEWIFNKGGTWLPRGFFDFRATDIVKQTLRCTAIAADPGPVIHWWREGKAMRDAYDSMGKLGKRMQSFPSEALLLSHGSRALVNLQLDLAACALERHRIDHGEYPDSLDPIPRQLTIDPLHGSSFRYKRTEEGFLLYSVGPNGVDDGGEEGKGSSMDQKDWVW